MKAFLVLIASLFISSALAADLAPVTKAPVYVAPANPCSIAGCSGFFVGAQISGSGTGVNVLNLGSLNAGGTFMGANAGYQFYNGVYWLGAKAQVEYDVGDSGASTNLTGAGAFQDKIFAFEGVEFGGAISGMFGLAPLNLPAWLSTAVPTVLVGACQHGSKLQGYCAGAAAHFFIPNSRWTIDAEYLNAQYGATQISPLATANTENRGSFGFSYHF